MVELVGRRDECRALADVLAAVRDGESRALVLHGVAGIGKTALLDEAARQASDHCVIRTAGIETEMEFAFSGLLPVVNAVADGIDAIPPPQRDALRTALGEQEGLTPDPFLVGLAVLNMLSERAHQGGVVVLVDDQHWLDRMSALILAFVARRLVAESVALIFATRVLSEDLHGLPAVTIGRLPDAASRTLLSRHLAGPLDRGVRDRILAEARGNPLALLEIPRTLRADVLAGGFGAPDQPVTHSLESTYRRQIEVLPMQTQRLLALAAAEPAGDPAVLWRAAEILGVQPDAAVPAIDAGLAEVGTRVLFRHPLIRSTAYRCVPLSDRQRIHAALAAVTDADADPDRRAWHRGHAAVGPDDEVADELELSADRVRTRGGAIAAAAFYERASALTVDRSRRCDLALAAAAAKVQAGALDAARELVAIADASPVSELQRARADLVRAQLAFAGRHGSDAAPLMLAAARRLESIDPAMARETYLDAMTAALFAGRLAQDGGMLDVAKAATAVAPGAGPPTPADLLLDGLALQYASGFEVGLSAVRAALEAYGRKMSTEQELRWMLLACFAAARAWDIDRHMALATRYVGLVRASGAVTQLPLALSACVIPLLFTGQFNDAARAVDEMHTAIAALGGNLTPFSGIVLAALRGQDGKVEASAAVARRDAERRGEGFGLTAVAWAQSLTANGRGDYRTACSVAVYASADRAGSAASWWALTELIEAATRIGDDEVASAALDRLCEMTTPSGTDWALGVEARSRALLSEGDTAELCYRDAIERLSRAGLRPDLGRAHLLYGEWLRRRRRRVDARVQLRAAHDLFSGMGMAGFAARAGRELLATGERARRRKEAPEPDRLTPQEAQIARLARAGLSNPEIGARLFISARTVQYHLGKVFAKLGIRSRSQLAAALPEDGCS